MKFIAYKYWLNEKFTQDTDPVHDLNIGISSSIEAQEKFFMSTFIKIKNNTKKILQFENAVQNTERYYNIPCFSFRSDSHFFSDAVLVVSDDVFKKVKKFWISSHYYLYDAKYIGVPCWVIIESNQFKFFKLDETDEMIKYVLKKLNE